MAMQIDIVNKKRNDKVEDYARERLEMVIGRYADRIAHVELHVVDENAIKGGNDKVCTIDIKLDPRGQLHVRARHDDIYSAIVKAVHRAETVIAKAVDKGHRGHEVRHEHGGVRNIPVELDDSTQEPVVE